MPRTTCPVCAAELHLSKAEAVFGRRITCPECGSMLEVVEEEPLELEEVFDFEEELDEDEF
ncbi:MAG: lysine biosynthesis protein LysW [Candidatus Bipolaricaulota bacterium]|nr:lysine biosynthesis protein LysW [Candidatus Bipolaricaulota bacterium]MDW8126914.1 lysine biosynthesis protein LysW [Candidatus Bipolaricaulota bacterium]